MACYSVERDIGSPCPGRSTWQHRTGGSSRHSCHNTDPRTESVNRKVNRDFLRFSQLDEMRFEEDAKAMKEMSYLHAQTFAQFTFDGVVRILLLYVDVQF